MPAIVDLLPDFEDYLRFELQRSPATLFGYRSDLKKIAEALPGDVAAITRPMLRAYIRSATRAGASPHTVRRRANAISSFWRWLLVEEVVERDIVTGLALPRLEQPIIRWLTEAELHRFVETPDPNPRNALAWKLLAWLGLRRNELLRLRVSDVDFANGLLIVRHTKSKRDRALPIPTVLLDDLHASTASRASDAFLLLGERGGYWYSTSLYHHFYAHCATAGLSDITPHKLRHSLATHLASRGVPLHIIQRLLGHKNVATTSRYLHAAPGDLRDALRLHVLNDSQNERL